MRSSMSLLSTPAGRCRRHCDEPRQESDENQRHSHKRWRDSGQETLPRLGDHRYERSIGMASVDLEIRSKHSAVSTKSLENNPQCEDLSSELTPCEIALDEWQENTHRWESIFWRSFQRSNEESSLP